MPLMFVHPSHPGRPSIRRFRLWPLLVLGALLLGVVAIAGIGSAPPASSQAEFADASFRTLWERTDGPVGTQAVKRGWVWGAVPGKVVTEPYNGLPGNTHLVQYFDKGRMELNDPNGNKNDPFYVTSGRLAIEMISGQQQTGVSGTYANRGPAGTNLASDVDDPTAPTYFSFNGVSNVPGAGNSRRATPLPEGAIIRTAIDRQGRVQPWPDNHPDYGVRAAYYEPTTGHNVPDVFWDYLNGQGTIIQDGQMVKGPLFYPIFSITGYPISEAYWSYVKVGGAYTDVLIQAYERRVLTFVPHFQAGYKVQMSNIGAQYYDWRYLNVGVIRGTVTPGGALPTPTMVPLPPLAQIRANAITYQQSITDLNGNAINITNAGQAPVSFNGWWLDSPKWDHVDRFYFPGGVVLAPGAQMIIHSGTGLNNANNIYMSRTVAMWDQKPYDLAVLYDNYGRQVFWYFPAAGQAGATPTPPGVPSPVLTPGQPTFTPIPGATTATPTKAVPTPQPTSSTPIATATPTATPSGGVTDRTPTSTVTRTVTRTVTPTP